MDSLNQFPIYCNKNIQMIKTQYHTYKIETQKKNISNLLKIRVQYKLKYYTIFD